MLVVQHMMISGDEAYLTSRSLPSSKHAHGQCLLPCVCGCVRAQAYLVNFACAGSTCPVLFHMRCVLGRGGACSVHRHTLAVHRGGMPSQETSPWLGWE